MNEAAIAVAVLGAILLHYAFSFQRFTLGIARKYSNSIQEIGALQILMTRV
jgi:hypothetical protein